MLNIPDDKIATIGDMPNGISMFEKSGISIAMAGERGSEESRDLRYSSSEEEGFANAVDRYVLKTPTSTC
jgi:hydroxymethylpyrimidine pyrophosphatase-like HAD family hydrolase